MPSIPMGRKHKAVGAGSTRQQSNSDAGKPGTANRTTTMSNYSRSTRTPRRGANDKWDEKKLMTSAKSELVKLDLVKLLARPEAWNILDKEEQQQIVDLLPDHVHPHPYAGEDGRIPALPESFLRYSNHWRDGVRQFQVDLENGRYDPKWSKQAEKAVQERAAGSFDKFKEQEFEEFWGQKQKFDRSLAAGESSQIKLGSLVEQGVVRVGDVWKYSRGFAHGRKIMVEKEAKLMELDGTRMTCIVAAGRRTFLPHVPDADFYALLAAYKSSISKGSTARNENQETGPEENVDATRTGKPGDVEAESNTVKQNPQADVDENHELQRLRKRSSETTIGPRKKQQIHAPAGESVPDENIGQLDGRKVDNDVPGYKNGDNSLELGPPETPRRTTRNRGRPRKDSLTVANQQTSSIVEDQKQSTGKPLGLSVEVRNSEPAGMSEFASVTIDNTTNPNAENNENVPGSTNKPETKETTVAGSVIQEDQGERQLATDLTTNSETAPQATENETVSLEQPPPYSLSPLTLGGVEVVILMDIQGATNLGNKLINLDGRIDDIPNGNAWKEFRCYRNNQDMGSLWEIRQAWYVKQK